MFEAHVLHLLRRYLGEYVHGLSAEALKISVWKGDVVLKDLKLKAEALNSLRLPVTVKAGFVGTITLKVPWKSLGKEPVIVLVDRVFVLAHPTPDDRTLKVEDREKLFQDKLRQIEEAESATLEAISRSKLGSPPVGNSWLGSLIATIIGNLKISIGNVHVRYEDSASNPGHPFSIGITLAKLAAVTMDEQENETFDTSGALDKLRKSLQLERLAMYHDSNSLPWKIDKKWEDLCPQEWIKIFEDGINEPATGNGTATIWAMNRNYLVSPINGVLKYHRLENQERNDPDVPFEKASLVLSDVSLTISEVQYYDWIKLLEVVSRHKTYVEVSHLRPAVSILQSPDLWWRYAAQAALQQKKMCYRFSWDCIQHLCQLRRQYIQLYVGLLQQLPSINNSEIREIEEHLDSKVILLWRLLAHAKVETVKSREQAEKRRHRKRGWFSFGWQAPAEISLGDTSEETHLTDKNLTKEEWQAINNLLRCQPDEEFTLNSGRDSPNMIQFLATVSVGQAAARIISNSDIEIVCGRFEQLHVSTKFKHRSIYCDVSLRFYGLSAPEGSLAQSMPGKQKENALAASFIHLPVGENLDWKLNATISPCHVTVFMDSYVRFLEFLNRSNAVSPIIASETATALQMKIEKVTRRAQEQFQMVLEEQSRFALDIDFDAPKVRIPIRACASSKCDIHFLLDFGHFTLHTKEGQANGEGHNLYSQFCISGRDIAAFFTDSYSDCPNWSLVTPIDNKQQAPISPVPMNADKSYSLIDRCGMAVTVDKIKLPHPSYPSTRISIQVPNLGLHFSPERYFRIMELLSTLYGTMEACSQTAVSKFQAGLAPCSLADLATNANILVWKGFGNSVATWQPAFLVLSGLYLYLLEFEKSTNYQRCLSMAGKQVFEVSPSNVGGSMSCIAVCFRGMDLQKALESSSTWIMELHDEEEKALWLKGLVQATYQASTPPSVDVLGESRDSVVECGDTQASCFNTVDLVIAGTVVETKLLIYGKTGNEVRANHDEALIIEVLAGGGKVHVICSEGDLTVKMKLHSLKIKDEFQRGVSMTPKYIACSVLRGEPKFTFPGSFDDHEKEVIMVQSEEDDNFKDALPDFMYLSEHGVNLQNIDISQCAKIVDNNDYDGIKSNGGFTCEQDSDENGAFSREIFHEAEDCDSSDFISLTFLSKSPGAPDYNGIDTQMSIRMSGLELFCNRPTVVALIGFGFDLSYVNSGLNTKHITASDECLPHKKMNGESGHAFVTGLLGYGKARAIFELDMNVDSVTVFLNKEDGSQLAIFVQESFLLDMKVHPSSVSIEGTLGNFRLRDMSVDTDDCWEWLCDIRNPGVDSLIKFTFNSYSAGDDDYEGYDYSLYGRLSAVRIVFLYKFVQEITVYFMELATPHPEEAIRLVDKVGDFEWLIQKYEIDGDVALKLDLSLDTPIIVVPKDSTSKDFIQLDLGQLQVRNEFHWFGGQEKDPSAVHIDVLHAKILGINMYVGVNGCIGKPMIREGQGLDIFVRRSLRDVFRKVPTFSIEVKVDMLHGVMSDMEYKVILDSVCMNLAELPKLPPSFRGSSTGSEDTMRLLVDKVNTSSQLLLSRTVTLMEVEINYALLELYNSNHDESAIAHIAMEGLWVSYRMTSLSEADLYVTIPKFSILDIRPDTKPEMRLMLGSCTDALKQASVGCYTMSSGKGSFKKTNSEASVSMDIPNSTMFLVDYRWRVSSQSFVVRIQQPRVLVVPDFLLAVVEFFVPALKSITGREEAMDPKNDPVCKYNSIMLLEPVYKQKEAVLHLSPSRKLVADAVGVDEYTYDGCGGTICLSEEETKEIYSSRSAFIIIVGFCKKLRFINVKIENGSFLSKYTYLSNGSSYSVAVEDGVEIMFLENNNPSNDGKKILDYMAASSDTPNSSSYSQNDPNKMQNFTFETQIVSSEFTFYDGTKSKRIDSSHVEKLLRAKMDLSFMYASSGSDRWIRALTKDLTVESDSGLIILDPVDISGGYTSVKDKTNTSVISTDISVHLSLSAISLIINLQNQAIAALRFRNANPLAPCTNFEKLWVSQKEHGSCKNLTFWRPRAPSNYVIFGDCCTSRPTPPSQAVMAVYNAYGRVRKPLGFKLIGFVSGIRQLERGEEDTGLDSDCSLWMPLAPSGYVALGCIAHIGSQPPPNHIVYCLRSDLVSSTAYSECIFNVLPNPQFTSGFSIWRIDNAVGSFYVHPSASCPPKNSCGDLSHVLIWSSNVNHSSPEQSTSCMAIDQDDENQEARSASSSGWNVLRSIARASNYYISTPHFERIWWDKGSDIRRPVSIWRPGVRPGYAILGDCITEGLEPPALGVIFKADKPEISAKPVQFTKVAQIISGRSLDEIFCWYPIAPPGYAALGCVVSKTKEAPLLDVVCCPRIDLVNHANILKVPVSRSLSSKASQSWSIWKVENQACTFLARADLKKPSSHLAFSIGNPGKPKIQENITAEMKLRSCSLTVLDSLGGTMTPLFDVTITNIKLATNGRPEAMNAVLISSIAASSFNTQLEAWEPLVEPFDGIFKFETYANNMHGPSNLGRRLRVAATSIVNLNVTAANLGTFADTIISWRRQLELEEKAMKLNEESGIRYKEEDSTDSHFSALDEDDFQTVIIENKLGCNIYVQKIDNNTNTVEVLHHDDTASVWVPPPRFSDGSSVSQESREARCYVAIQILEAKSIPIVDDGNSHKFFCALRLVIENQTTDQQKLFPQSARTKCVKPVISKSNNVDEGSARWNELFIFEIPRRGPAKVEIEVTNLAAKAGKGQVVGAFSFSIGHGTHTLKKVASVRMLHQAHDNQNIKSYPLRGSGRMNTDEESYDCGNLLLSTTYFERKTIANFPKTMDSINRDVGFCVGLSPEGSWESFPSLLPVTVVPKMLGNNFLAMEVLMRKGKKHVVFRGLVTIANDSDVKLDISTCHVSILNNNVITAINPGTSTVLPWRSTLVDSDQCLQVRPCVDHPQSPYSWGYAVTVGSNLSSGKDPSFTEQVSLSRQNTLTKGNKMPDISFKLNKLEKKDMLLSCSPSTGSKQFWLSVGTDASVLHTDFNAPVYDWKISINSPLKLENRLPCPAEYTIWERTRRGSTMECQHGIISSRMSVHIYSVDLRKPIYLTLFVHGGWALEKDPVLILDISSNDHVSSFWMVHQHSKRRLRVSIERDVGGASAAPKTIRLFVPYWIVNDTSLTLKYRVVEIESVENAEVDSPPLSRAVKSAKTSMRNPSNSMDRRLFGQRKNIQVLEVIEDTSPVPSMLAPQDYASRSGLMLFSSRNDTYMSPRLGIALTISQSDIYGPGISLLDIENKERVDVKAFASDGSYYKLSTLLNLTSDRTKVIHFQPHTLFINRVGRAICLQQYDSQCIEWIHPTDPPKPFRWQSSAKLELLKLRVDGCKWSTPFSIGTEGAMCIFLKKDGGSEEMSLRVKVRNGVKCSRYEVIFRPNSMSSLYRIENRSMFLPIHFRQVDGMRDSWRLLLSNAAASFLWEDLGRRKLLELLADGADPLESKKYDIDEICDHQPVYVSDGASRALRVTILREERTNIVRISDWLPENEPAAAMSRRLPKSFSPLPVNDFPHEQSPSNPSCEFHVVVELADLGLSIIDHTPEEILYFSVQNLLFSYSTGLDSGISRFKLKMHGIQVDNQLPLTPMPVLFRPQRVGEETDYILKCSVTAQSNRSLDLIIYPYVGFHGPENSAFLINIHEPIIWRVHEMIQRLNLNSMCDTQKTAVSVDPFIQIGVLNTSEVRLKVSMAMSPTQRPRGVLGFWSSLMTALGNTENMPVRINQRFHENVCMRQSAMISNAVSNIRKDLLSQPLQLLSGVDILGNASSALGHMSKGVAALSMDKKFIQSRQRQESKGVEDFGDVIREGGGALAKGLFRGVTGILTKPLEGAKTSGVEGFVQGVGKGILGAAAQPVSGVLDLLSKTTEGANAMRTKIISAIISEEQLLRRRLPRVIGGDNLLRPYDEYKAQGQVILQLAESGAFLFQVDLFKVRGKFALSDAYEDHFLLPKGKILVTTHRRAILLQQPSNIIAQKKFSPARDPCSVSWDVMWDELITMELNHGKKDSPAAPPSRLYLYLQPRSTESKEQFRVIKCNRETCQALEVFSSIERAVKTYGPNQSKEMLKKKVTRPYSPMADVAGAEISLKEGSPSQVPASVPLRSTFGSSTS